MSSQQAMQRAWEISQLSERERISRELRRLDYLKMRGVLNWHDIQYRELLRRKAAELDYDGSSGH